VDATACAGDSGFAWLGAEQERRKIGQVAASLDQLISTCEPMVCGEDVQSPLIWLKVEVLLRSSAQTNICCSNAQVWTQQKSWQHWLNPSCWSPCL